MVQPIPPSAVNIPAEIKSLLAGEIGEAKFSAWVTEAVVVEAARQHIISRRKAATLMGLAGYEDREAFFERHDLRNEYTVEMVEEDFKTLEALRALR